MGLSNFLAQLLYTETISIDKDLFDLNEGEEWWSTRFAMLESRGYRLRERLRPGWIPPWVIDPNLPLEFCEDAAHNLHPQITDATRIADGSCVIIKKICQGSDKRDIAVSLSSVKDERDERNHCVPIFDAFPDDTDEDLDPPFVTVEELVDFIRQTLEGLSFMHSLNVAHRDCSDLNIMLDGTPIYPQGFHPVYRDRSRDWFGRAKFVNRGDVPEVKYYFTDFGISTRFSDSDRDRFVTGRICQAAVPELSNIVPYNSFAVDVYLIGNVYRRHFVEKYTNLWFLRPLVDWMVETDPARRPTANDALKLFGRIVSQEPAYIFRWKLLEKEIGYRTRFMINFKCGIREGLPTVLKLLGFRHSKETS